MGLHVFGSVVQCWVTRTGNGTFQRGCRSVPALKLCAKTGVLQSFARGRSPIVRQLWSSFSEQGGRQNCCRLCYSLNESVGKVSPWAQRIRTRGGRHGECTCRSPAALSRRRPGTIPTHRYASAVGPRQSRRAIAARDVFKVDFRHCQGTLSPQTSRHRELAS